MSAFSRQPYFWCNYDWKIDFSDNYLPYNADYVEVNFNIYIILGKRTIVFL